MKAIVYTKYGTPDNLSLQDVEKPVPKDDEVLIKVKASSINKADFYMLAGKPFLIRASGYGLFKPKNTILGCDVSGTIESAGKAVKELKAGDDVYGDIFDRPFGAYAEYVAVKESVLSFKPSNMSFEEAAAVPLAGVTALKGLRKGNIKAGQKVLINGASGGVGTYAVQLAKYFGAEVTAVCSAGNTAMARELGADHVIDYAKEDFTKGSIQYDLILAVNGYHTLQEYSRVLKPEGVYVSAGGTMGQIFQAVLLGPWVSMAGKKKFYALTSNPEKKALLFLKEVIEAGRLKPFIEKRYPLSQTADAFCYFGEGHTKGKIVITV